MRELPLPFWPLGQYRQFIIYLVVPSKTRPGKTDKFPCDFRTGDVVSAHDPVYWTDCSTAISAAAQYGERYGVGFVFTDNDPFFFVDMDNCLLPTGEWSPVAIDICSMLPGAALEVSQSGSGLHAFGSGRPPAHGCKNTKLGLEFYNTGRFVALTGLNAMGDAAVDFTHVLASLVDKYFPPSGADVGAAGGWTTEADPSWRGPDDDDDLIRRALRSQSAAGAFGNKATFADLWGANVDVLRHCYPDEVRPYDESSADAALAQHLAFWTGKNCERMLRLMEKSALARDKWDRKDYLPRTILSACGRQFEVLTDKAVEPVALTVQPIPSADKVQPDVVAGSTFIDNSEQLTMFAGCVYVKDLHQILIPGGYLINPSQFKVIFGGYLFTMDNENRATTKDAWEAFTQNRTYRCPKVDTICFKPDLPAGCIVNKGGQSFVNTWFPVDVPRKFGDPTPFLQHMAKILPDERDRLIVLCYMAACVQHKGVKFQWAPLIQGVEGNGKTLLARCVAQAIGSRYTHWPKASKLCNQFNKWMIGNVFYAVEDIYVPGHKLDVIEELKPMITGGDGLEIEGKGIDQISADICGNFMFNCNRNDAMPITDKSRRLSMFFTPQQKLADLARDGMDGDYFFNLYNWLKADGFAIVTDFLYTYPIADEFNPATKCQRAPQTTSTRAAVQAGLGAVEQEIQEAIAQASPGFAGGWVSSIQLDHLLQRLGVARRISLSKRQEMLEGLGYVIHPHLPGGRVNNPVIPDNGKPRLFILKDHPSIQLTRASDVAKEYERVNNFFATNGNLHI